MTGTNLPVTSSFQSWIFLLVICLFSLVIGNDCLQEFWCELDDYGCITMRLSRLTTAVFAAAGKHHRVLRTAVRSLKTAAVMAFSITLHLIIS